MTKKTKQITLGALAAVMAVSVPIVSVVSCGTTEKKPNRAPVGRQPLSKRVAEFDKAIHANDDDSNKIVDANKVNMVSLGDSVAAGFTLLDKKDHRGFMNAAGDVSGSSYGSYMAKAFKSQSKLEDFNNFAIAGSTTETLRNLVDPTHKLSGAGLSTKKTIAKLVDKNEEKRFATIQAKLKKANLVTISIGANDVLANLKLGGKTIGEIMAAGTENFELDMSGGIDSLISYDQEKFDNSIEDAIVNLEATVAKIKTMNPKAKIAMVGYPMPITQLAYVLRIVKDKSGKALSDKILKSVDRIGRSISKKFKTVDYIDGYVKSVWDDNALELAPELMDIHPGVKGYKMMAATVIANLSKSTANTSLVDDDANKNLFIPTIAPKRLGADYTQNITEFSDITTALSASEAQVQANAKPWKMVHIIATLIPKLTGQLDGMLKKMSAAPTLPTSSMYEMPVGMPTEMTSYGMMEKLGDYLPSIEGFLALVFKSAEYGLASGDAKIIAGVKQDLDFIMGSVSELANKVPLNLVGENAAQGDLLQTLVGMIVVPALKRANPKGLANANTPKLIAFFPGRYLDATLHAKDTAFFKTLADNGPADNYI